MAYKEDLLSSFVELVYGTTNCFPEEFFDSSPVQLAENLKSHFDSIRPSPVLCRTDETFAVDINSRKSTISIERVKPPFFKIDSIQPPVLTVTVQSETPCTPVIRRFCRGELAERRMVAVPVTLVCSSSWVRRWMSEKNAEDTMDIHDVSKCCYMSIVIDTFKKRPGATQCYNCIYFNHSSTNCEMKPRCLKCSKDHRNGDSPIKERIENPQCINGKKEGHMAQLQDLSSN
ncbi:nucleic-acid-binding protein from transposon X-element [Trichonephila clavipes]|nr:nucleic-acid-binding protein from transposon X-element [Trichonephila clavipes]